MCVMVSPEQYADRDRESAQITRRLRQESRGPTNY